MTDAAHRSQLPTESPDMPQRLITLLDGALSIGGVPVFEGDTAAFVDFLIDLSSAGEPSLVVTPNVDQVINLSDFRDFAKAYRTATVAVLDGMPLVTLARRMGSRHAYRITGSDLIEVLTKRAAARGTRVVLAGGASATTQLAAAGLRERTGADVIPVEVPYVSDVADPRGLSVAHELSDHAGSVFFLCLGSPKQELWFDHWRPHLPPGVYIGAGAAVDFAAGRIRRAPAAIQALHCEWIWRLAHEPRRLWHRYLVKGPRFAAIAARALSADPVSAAR